MNFLYEILFYQRIEPGCPALKLNTMLTRHELDSIVKKYENRSRQFSFLPILSSDISENIDIRYRYI